MNKKLFTLATIFLLFSMCFVIAQASNDGLDIHEQGQKNNYLSENQEQIQKLERHRNMFENKYNFSCQNECNYMDIDGETVRLQVKQQKKFLFWNVNVEENYTLDNEGKIIQARYNFWSWFLNQEKLKSE